MRNQVQEHHLLWQLTSVFAGSNMSTNINTTFMAGCSVITAESSSALHQMRPVKLGHGYTLATLEYPKSMGHSTLT